MGGTDSGGAGRCNDRYANHLGKPLEAISLTNASVICWSDL